ncbi:hypothetical protein ODS41_06030 [Pyrobaculum sp. 3827-6]|uniref:hypothetical protein n=1 Tax=Pyrobaculum sp. 3827-6 TaxID=2983604 RepID=UPI0021D98177|nr:hypothetical protein [Pyrobaculum sp. 3827-6]MCU7787475.1 hypothetical protein [Pyrobaculum sp. 3827-6]
MRWGVYVVVAVIAVVAVLALVFLRGSAPTPSSTATALTAPGGATGGVAVSASWPVDVAEYEVNYTFAIRVEVQGVEARIEGWLLVGEGAVGNYTYGRLRLPLSIGWVEIYSAYFNGSVVTRTCVGGVCHYSEEGAELFTLGAASRNVTKLEREACRWRNYTGVLTKAYGTIKLGGFTAPFSGRGNFTEVSCATGRLVLTSRLEVNATAESGMSARVVYEAEASRVGPFNKSLYRLIVEELRRGARKPTFADLLKRCYGVYAAVNGSYKRVGRYPATADVVYVIYMGVRGDVMEKIAEDARRGTVYVIILQQIEPQLPAAPEGLHVASCPKGEVLSWLTSLPGEQVELGQDYIRVALK